MYTKNSKSEPFKKSFLKSDVIRCHMTWECTDPMIEFFLAKVNHFRPSSDLYQEFKNWTIKKVFWKVTSSNAIFDLESALIILRLIFLAKVNPFRHSSNLYQEFKNGTIHQTKNRDFDPRTRFFRREKIGIYITFWVYSTWFQIVRGGVGGQVSG